MQDKHRVWLSIGSNRQRTKNIKGALAALQAEFGELIVSRVYQSPAVGFVGDDFYNLVAGITTGLTVPALVTVLRDIEKQHGRTRDDAKFNPRTLDIDVLTYGDTVSSTDGIEIPRDEILKYAFVLGPLSEVAADELHPVSGQRYVDLWATFPEAEKALLQPILLAATAG